MLFFARRYNLFHDIVIGYFIVIFIRVWLIRFLKTYGIYKKKLEAASSPAAADESRQQTSKKKTTFRTPYENARTEPFLCSD